jgi:hypothetical protein
VPTPTVPGWGFFMRAASRAVWNCSPSLHVGEEEERGKQAVVPPAALPPSILYSIVATACNAWRRVPCVLTRLLQRTRGCVVSGYDHRHILDYGSASTSWKGHSGVSHCRSDRGALSDVETASLRSRLTRDVSNVCWGFSTACRSTSTRWSSRMGRPPVLGVWFKT